MTMTQMIDLFCIASGPSLTADDCELVRRSGVEAIAVNESWQLAPFCKHIYGGEFKWWSARGHQITVPAERWTCSHKAAMQFGVRLHRAKGGFNSGMRAIQWGIWRGARCIALLGYDCSIKRGLHWHGAHTTAPLKNPTEEKLIKWQGQFARIALAAKRAGVNVINCSRQTELKCFDRVQLEEALSCQM